MQPDYIISDLWPLVVGIDEVQIDPSNAMTHDEANLDQIAGSLNKHKQRKPVVINRATGTIEAGNGTLIAARRLGWQYIAVVGEEDDAQTAVSYGIADNAVASQAWDWERLKKHLDTFDAPGEVPGVDDGLLATLKEALAAEELNGKAGGDAEPQVDRAAELQRGYGTEVGQLWRLGEHRLAVGDCMDKEVVEGVMDGEKPFLCVTSPPYPGANMWNNEDEDEDKEKQINRLMDLAKNILEQLWVYLIEGGVVCWNVQDVPWGNHGIITTTTTTTTIAVKEIGFSIRGNIIWDKGIPHLPLPWNMRRPCVPNMTHEHILVLFKGDWVPREKKTGLSDEEKTCLAHGVWRIATESAKKIGHKAPFPLELPKRCIGLFSIQNDIVYDPFLGSGTTLIACENLGRRCRGIEIDPGYAAVTLRRWEELTGGKAERIIDNG